MIKSMTGYGRAEKVFDEYKITVEAKSVNNRYLDCNFKVYRQYSFLEDAARSCVSSVINRGKVDVYIQLDSLSGDSTSVTLNESAAREYHNALQELSKLLNIEDDITASTMTRFQDIFNIEKKEQDIDKITADAREVIMSALYDLVDTRKREGERLRVFFDDCGAQMMKILDIIKDRSPATVKEYETRIKERIEELLSGTDIDDARLMTEVAIFADKVNITEEITRFESHFKEFSNLLESDIPVGRKLDFIIQEFNREANTMGSKCNDYVISKAVVDLKSEIEKLREQVQNIE